MTEIRILNAADVRRCLPPADCIAAMRLAMIALSKGLVGTPPRMFVPVNDKGGTLGLMPGVAPGIETYGVKVLSVHPDNPAAGRPLIQGQVLLFDATTGSPVALIDGSELTALRTAAVSALATDLLARKEAGSHAIFGTGVQAYSHAHSILAVRPGIERILIWGRNAVKAEALAERLRDELDIDVHATTDAATASAADIISTVTAASEPVVATGSVRPGTHVNLVGPHRPKEREADGALMARGRIYVDSLDSALREAGDILMAIDEGQIAKTDIVGEIGSLALGEISGRTGADQITIFKSVGISAQDVYAGHAVLEHARRAGIGLVDGPSRAKI